MLQLGPCHSKCGPWNSSRDVTWRFIHTLGFEKQWATEVVLKLQRQAAINHGQRAEARLGLRRPGCRAWSFHLWL